MGSAENIAVILWNAMFGVLRELQSGSAGLWPL